MQNTRDSFEEEKRRHSKWKGKKKNVIWKTNAIQGYRFRVKLKWNVATGKTARKEWEGNLTRRTGDR